MALDAGIQVAQGDLVVKGGVKKIYLTEYSTIAITSSNNGELDWTTSAAANKIWNFEFELETANWSYTSASERGSTIVEHTIEFYVPNMNKTKLQELQGIQNIPLLVVCCLQAGTEWCIGYSPEYKSDNGVTNDQMFAMISAVEFNSGTAFGDTSGATIRITARAGELPLQNAASLGGESGNAVVVS